MAEIYQRPADAHRGKGPSISQVLAVVALFPVGGTLLTTAGIILAGTLIGLAVSTPLFVIFSPILVPAALTLALAVAGFLTAGAFGVTALASVLVLFNHVKKMGREHPEPAQRRVRDTAGYLGKKAQDLSVS